VTRARVHRRSLSSELISFSSKREEKKSRDFCVTRCLEEEIASEHLGGKRALGMHCELLPCVRRLLYQFESITRVRDTLRDRVYRDFSAR